MQKKSLIFKYSLLVLIFIFLFLHVLYKEFNFIKIPPLKGFIIDAKNPDLNLKDCFDGVFQQKEDAYINDAFGLRSLYVRLHNQMDFSFFKKFHSDGVVMGKENYFFEEQYINAFKGADFMGLDSINILVNQIKFVSNYMSKIGKHLIIIFAPDKASFFSEYIPDNYRIINDSTNYKYISEGLKNVDVNIIDFHKWFIDNKTKSKYPLYPQYGTHWSNYGAVLAADSIIKEIEFLKKMDMPNLIYNEVDLKQPIYIDYDIADGMNLLFRLKSYEMAYPHISTERRKNKKRPDVLVVSDSFYWGMYDFGIGKSFNHHHFWYYNKLVYPELNKKELLVENINLANEIESHDVFILMATNANLRKMSWGFLDNLENLFASGWIPEGGGGVKK